MKRPYSPSEHITNGTNRSTPFQLVLRNGAPGATVILLRLMLGINSDGLDERFFAPGTLSQSRLESRF